MSKWQTIEKFKKSPVVGWCRIWQIDLNYSGWKMAYYNDKKFYWSDFVYDKTDYHCEEKIKHVMPLDDPAPPGNKYPYISMNVGDVEVLDFATDKDRQNAMCAAHQIGYRHGWKFKSDKRTTDAGKFELTVTRVK
jgi:hypothetical protein